MNTKNKILITAIFLDGYHGSVIHLLEWSEFFLKNNFDVEISTLYSTKHIQSLFNSKGITIKNIFDEYNDDYYIVLAYHFPIIGFLLKNGLKCNKLVIGSLSGLERLEAPSVFWKVANSVLVMSEKTKKLFNEKYFIPLDKIKVIENCVPDYFFEKTKTNQKEIKKIAVISNHIPAEILALKKELKHIKIDFIGEKSPIYCLITPDLLLEYDIVISIGKTVQYALGLGIPIYEYDQFGGCGYITPDNFENEKNNTFCGMFTERKLSTQEIKKELIEGYENAVCNTKYLRELALQHFLLSKRLEDFLSELETTKDFDRELLNSLPDSALLEMDHNEAFCKWIYSPKRELDSIKNSKCWKITKPIRDIKTYINKIKSKF